MRKIYSLVLIAVGLLISGNAFGAGDITDWTDEADAISKGAVCKIGTEYYSTLALAVADVPETVVYKTQDTEFSEGEATQITMLQDVTLSSKVTIPCKKNVILELNGKVISCSTEATKGFEVIENCGILTIQDNTDTKKNGDGIGKITSIAYNPDMAAVPGYATNTIINCGKLTILSGFIESGSLGSASYAIDNQAMNPDSHAPSYGQTNYQNKVELYIQGGKVKANQSYSIRQYLSTDGSRDNIIDISGGIVYRLWVQDSGAQSKGSLTIKNATLPQGLQVGYADNNGLAKSEHFELTVDHCVFGEYLLYKLDPTKSGNTISIKNSAIGSFYMVKPEPIFTEADNNIYNFAKDINAGWIGDDAGGETAEVQINTWEAVDGQYIIRDEQYGTDWEHGYITAAKSLNLFYKYIKSGGLISVVYEGFENPYKLGKLVKGNDYGTPGEGSHTTKIDPAGGTDDPNLANYWHKPATWIQGEGWGGESHAEQNPMSGDPVCIDHNVIVEAGTTADAASIVIEPGMKLIVEDGATLHIEDAGALFKDETAQMIISPSAIVTVGSNGIIADNVENIVIKSDKNGTGVLLMNPEVTINTRPLATVKMFTKAGKRNNKWWWQHFGIPTSDAPAVSNDRDADTYVQKWVNSDWESLSTWSEMNTPFLGYNLTNSYAGNDGVTYTFTGNLVGNNDAQLNFVQKGYNLMANSYTGPLDLKTMFEKLSTDLGDNVEITAWVYEAQEGQYWWANKGEIETENAGKYTIAPMQGFILRLINGTTAQGEVDYTKSIWENPHKVGIPLMSPARQGASDVSKARVVVSANGKSDLVKFYQKDEYSGDFENGYDASKYMNEHFNLFVESGNENLATVASNDMNGLYLTLQADENVEYTLSFENVNDFNYSILDIQTGITTPMVEGATYDFVASPNTTISNRFQIVSARTTPTTLDNVKAAASRNGVYTVLGQFVGKKVDFNKLPAGVYVVDGQRIAK